EMFGRACQNSSREADSLPQIARTRRKIPMVYQKLRLMSRLSWARRAAPILAVLREMAQPSFKSWRKARLDLSHRHAGVVGHDGAAVLFEPLRRVGLDQP